MSNPLVAEVKDDTKAFTGVPLLESVNDTAEAIEKGDWAAGVLGAVGTAMDAASMAMDPFGAILASGVGWLMEHVGPLKEALDALAGDPDEIKAHSETWKNIAGELESISGDLKQMVTNDTASWTGPGGDSYRKRGEDTATLVTAAQSAASGASEGVGTAGTVVDAVRTLVRDIIAELVGHMISWALQVVFTLGIGMAWVVPQVITAVAKTAAKIADITMKLVKAMKALSPLLKKLGDGFDEASKALKNIKSSKPPAPDKPNDKPRGGGGDTGPSGAKPDGNSYKGPDNNKPDGNTTPSSDKGPDTTPSSDKGPDTTPNSNKSPDTTPNNGQGTTPSSTPDVTPKSPDVTPKSPPKGDNTTPSSTPKGDNTTPSSTPKGQDPAKTKEPNQKCTEFDPIDVATGDVLVTEADLFVPGALGELIVREHVSSYRDGRWFGPSWASLVDERLVLAGGSARYYSADAMVLDFPVPAPGVEVSCAHGPLRLLHSEGADYVINDPGRGLHRRFVRAPGDRDEFLLHEVRAESGEFVELERDAEGAPALLRHSGGAQIALDTADGRVRAVRALSPTGDVPVARYEYDEHGHLAQRTNSTPRPARYDHDVEGRLLGLTDHNGVWYRHVYDEAGRCVRTVGDQGYLDGTLSYAEGRTTTTDSLGHQKVFEFDAAGNAVAETDKLGGVTRSEWGPRNLLLARTDPLGRRTEFEHDAAGILRAVLRPDGSRVAILDSTDAALEIEVTDGERTLRRRYAAPAMPDPYTDPLGVSDDTDDVPVVNAQGSGPQANAVERDLFGRPRTVGRTMLTWTVEGGLHTMLAADGARQQWTYDGEGEEISHIDPLNRATRTERGPFGIITATTDAAGARTTRRFDTELRLVAVTSPAGQTWEYTYDAEGRLLAQSDFDGRVTSCTYDAAGQLVRVVNAASEVVEYRYDLLGNLLERTSAAGTETYRYDPVGRLVHAAGPDAEIELERDDEGRVVRQVTAGRTTTFAYPGSSASVRRTPSNVDVQWGRNADGVDTLTVAGTTLALRRDSAGRPVTVIAGTNPLVQQEFDVEGRLATQRTPAGLRRYHRRPDGSIATREDPAGGARYEFDPVGRIAAVHTPGGAERYAYDVVGNLVSSSPGTGAESGPRRYSGGVLESAGAVRYVHDAQGRLIQRTVGELTWMFTWDAQDHLTGVRTPDGTVWRYRYDPLDRRVAKQRLDPAGGIAEQVEFVWDGNTLIEALHTVGGVLTGTFTWIHHPDNGRPVAQAFTAPDGTTRLSALVTDDVGTPVELVAADSGAVRPLRTSLFGLVRAGDGAATPLRFPGQYHDPESGLYFNVFRYYDPANGRYVSPDPLGLDPAPNPLTYVADPLMASDPLGLTGSGGLGDDPGNYRRFSGRKVISKCKNAVQQAQQNFPYPRRKPTKKTTAPSSSTPQAPGKFGNHQSAIDNPTGPKDPVTGRKESQGGGTTSGGPHTVDGRTPQRYGSTPKDGNNTDVIELNDAARNKTLNSTLQKQIDDMRADPKVDPKADPFIRGHLRNDNLGGEGDSDNLTALSRNANGSMQGAFEGPLKKTDTWLQQVRDLPSHDSLARRFGDQDAKAIREDFEKLSAEYKVTASDGNKFPNSPNEFERSIRDNLKLDAEWKYNNGNDLSDATKAYLAANPSKLNTMPIFPPMGTKMDTITGEMKMPDGNIYNADAARAARKADYEAILDDRLNQMDLS